MQCQLLTTLRKKPSKNIVGKGGNVSNKHFLFSTNICNLSKKKLLEKVNFSHFKQFLLFSTEFSKDLVYKHVKTHCQVYLGRGQPLPSAKAPIFPKGAKKGSVTALA